MICFEVEINGEKVCTAGVGEFGVLTATLAWVRNRVPASSESEDFNTVAFNLGGLTDNQFGDEEFVDWIRKRLSVGTEIRVRVIDTPEYDEPLQKR